ncbi:uncharacterized protein LOC120177527 [Hibiscus syriacus]|uniref:uncharacterized protein LOC120177527 n=1 Tax=Hibiscus syriacus TaxID=106335 RepID=UPI0019212CD7|nr:uncharacterized protein LOC120177527 [Hibiscus syriacus]
MDRIIEKRSCSQTPPPKIRGQIKRRDDTRPVPTSNWNERSYEEDSNFRSNVKSSTRREPRNFACFNPESLARLQECVDNFVKETQLQEQLQKESVCKNKEVKVENDIESNENKKIDVRNVGVENENESENEEFEKEIVCAKEKECKISICTNNLNHSSSIFGSSLLQEDKTSTSRNMINTSPTLLMIEHRPCSSNVSKKDLMKISIPKELVPNDIIKYHPRFNLSNSFVIDLPTNFYLLFGGTIQKRGIDVLSCEDKYLCNLDKKLPLSNLQINDLKEKLSHHPHDDSRKYEVTKYEVKRLTIGERYEDSIHPTSRRSSMRNHFDLRTNRQKEREDDVSTFRAGFLHDENPSRTFYLINSKGVIPYFITYLLIYALHCILVIKLFSMLE